MQIFILIFSLAIAALAEAKSLQKVLEKYAKASTLQFDMKKTDEKIILGTKTETEGLLKYQKGQLYIIQQGDKKVELFYADKTLTLVEHPDVDFDPDGNRKVTVLKKTSSPLVKSLLSVFSSPKAFAKNFIIESKNTEDGLLLLELKSQIPYIKKLSLKIDLKNTELNELSFVDDVETRTTLRFANSRLNSKMSKKEFQYKFQKTDEVIAQ